MQLYKSKTSDRNNLMPLAIQPSNSAMTFTDNRTNSLLLQKKTANKFNQSAFNVTSINRPASIIQNKNNAHTSIGNPIIQRVLNRSDAEAFHKWLIENKIQLHEEVTKRILLESSHLDEAKHTATIEAESAKQKGRRLPIVSKAMSSKSINEEEFGMLQQIYQDLSSPGLGESLPQATASLAEVLLNEYPPSKFTYIMMGNSPAPLMAFLAINGVHSFHLPLGGITDVAQSKKGFVDNVNESQELINHYLDRALGEAASQGKPMVLIDYVSSGSSMIMAMDLIKSWLAARKKAIAVQFFGFTDHSPEELPNLMQGTHAGVLATAKGKMEKIFIKMLGRKDYKSAFLLKGPASMEMEKLLETKDPAAAMVMHIEHYKRLVKMMLAQFKK